MSLRCDVLCESRHRHRFARRDQPHRVEHPGGPRWTKASRHSPTRPPPCGNREDRESMIWAALPHRNREHQPTVRCAVYIYLSLRRLGLEKVGSLRQRDMSSRSGRRYAGRQGGGTLGGPCAARRGARGARVRTASRNYRTNVGNYALRKPLWRPGRPRIGCGAWLVRANRESHNPLL